MYSINLEKITLDEFQEILTSIDLLPGRRILLGSLPEIVERLKQRDILHLEALRKLLQNKKHYPELAQALSVSVDYLTILNREVNSYVSKPVMLSELGVFSAEELTRLTKAGVKSTKDLYERALTPTARQELSARLALPAGQIVMALELSDLLRINGVGPVYAKILREMGIKSAPDYLNRETAWILEKYQEINAAKQPARAKLGLKDIEYCQRFCRKLDADIEW
jgi:hypothetical protein